MIPKITQIDTSQVSDALKLVGNAETKPADPQRTPLRPELREAAEASWERNEAAYRYLGR